MFTILQVLLSSLMPVSSVDFVLWFVFCNLPVSASMFTILQGLHFRVLIDITVVEDLMVFLCLVF